MGHRQFFSSRQEPGGPVVPESSRPKTTHLSHLHFLLAFFSNVDFLRSSFKQTKHQLSSSFSLVSRTHHGRSGPPLIPQLSVLPRTIHLIRRLAVRRRTFDGIALPTFPHLSIVSRSPLLHDPAFAVYSGHHLDIALPRHCCSSSSDLPILHGWRSTRPRCKPSTTTPAHGSTRTLPLRQLSYTQASTGERPVWRNPYFAGEAPPSKCLLMERNLPARPV